MQTNRLIESLESRRLLSSATLNGGLLRVLGDSETTNDIAITVSGDDLVVAHNGNTDTFAKADVRHVLVRGGAESDTVNVATLGVFVRVMTWGGDDNVTTGDDRCAIFLGDGNDTAAIGDGKAVIYGGDGDDSITVGNGGAWVFAGRGNDTIVAGDGRNLIHGGSGNDNITAGNGNNRIFGGAGNDTMTSGSGNDWLFGGSGTAGRTGCSPSLAAIPSIAAPDPIRSGLETPHRSR